MTFLVINDDEDFSLEIVHDEPTMDRVLFELRNMGSNKCRLPRESGTMGWVSDVGSINEAFARNPVATCVMATLGGQANILGGPIVFTGFDYPQRGEQEWGFPEELTQTAIAVICGAYIQVRDALGMQVPQGLERFRSTDEVPADWPGKVRSMAEWARTAPNPGLTINGGTQQHTPASAAAAVLDQILGRSRSTLQIDLVVATRNPQLLDTTIRALPMVAAQVLPDTFDGTKCVVRATGDVKFLKFALANQGYGEVLDEIPVPPEGS